MIFLRFDHDHADGKKCTTAILPSGRHSLQFNFKIPSFSLPSSFESRHGHVKYWLKARIDRPWRFDESTTTEFDILDLVDVNCPRMLVCLMILKVFHLNKTVRQYLFLQLSQFRSATKKKKKNINTEGLPISIFFFPPPPPF